MLKATQSSLQYAVHILEIMEGASLGYGPKSEWAVNNYYFDHNDEVCKSCYLACKVLN